MRENVTSEKKFQLDQHLKTTRHIKVVKITTSKLKTFLTNPSFSNNERKLSRVQNDLALDLCETMIGSNVPLNKFNNSNFKKFLKKLFINLSVPDELSFRKKNSYIV